MQKSYELFSLLNINRLFNNYLQLLFIKKDEWTTKTSARLSEQISSECYEHLHKLNVFSILRAIPIFNLIP